MNFKAPQRPLSLSTRLLATEAPPPWGQLTAISIFVISILCFIIAAVLTLPSGLAGATLAEHWLALNIGALLSIIFLILRMRNPGYRGALRFSHPPVSLNLLYFIAWGLLLSFSLDLLGQILTGRILPPLELIDTFALRAELSLVSLFLAILFMMLGQPVVEETLLRGILYPAMRARLRGNYGLLVAIISNALVHTILHNALYGGLGNSADIVQYWLVIIWPLLAGLAFTIARVMSQSTLVAVLVHAGASAGALLKVFLL